MNIFLDEWKIYVILFIVQLISTLGIVVHNSAAEGWLGRANVKRNR